MKLTSIEKDGGLPEGIAADEYLKMIVEMTITHYARIGFQKPWIGYIAIEDSEPIGVCGFKSAPVKGRVEIAYGTLPGHEGRGIATAMAAELVRIAKQEEVGLAVFAQTLPEDSASTSILKKLGFSLIGSIKHPEDGTVWEWEIQ